MESINLYRYYQRLLGLELGKEHAVTLGQVSEMLFASPRHTRSILKMMTEKRWISWLPRVGRNQRSTLIRALSDDEVKRDVASGWVKSSQYDKALEFLQHDQVAFGQLLQQNAGAQVSEGKVRVQLTYNRSFTELSPRRPQRNSERFLIRQVHAGLVTLNEQGDVVADIAHHWEAEQNFHVWRFYLRPSVYFHNGGRVDAKAVSESLAYAQSLPYFRNELDHVVSIEAVAENTLEVTLTRQDKGFAALLTDLKYSIEPRESLSSASSSTTKPVIGCGVFSLAEHTLEKMELTANDRYHGLRALTDQVSIWSLKKDLFSEESTSCNHSVTDSVGHEATPVISHPELDYLADEGKSEGRTDSKARIEHGCMFMIFNQRNTNLNHDQRRWLSQALSGEQIWKQLQRDDQKFGAQNATNFFPFWQPIKRLSSNTVMLPDTLNIAFYHHPGITRGAKAMKRLLQQQGVEVILHDYSFDEFIDKSFNQGFEEELVLSSLNLDDNYQVSALLFFLSDPVLHATIGDELSTWLIKEINQIRANSEAKDYLTELEPFGSMLIHEGVISPMFHHRQTLSFEGVIKGVEITSWGWPQLRDVWSAG
ncbi:SgrR family transcriptional regulator [Vibrio sp. CB1-14]|uniref:SgrR family transcriptional regulator n=1 Tax=Vibrio chaetopteri TaxID=3016528 RepID=A0AAU8BR92_9VIBR